jgi:hypothetical protein
MKSEKMQLPLRHEDTKFHKELNFNNLFLLHICAFVVQKLFHPLMSLIH